MTHTAGKPNHRNKKMASFDEQMAQKLAAAEAAEAEQSVQATTEPAEVKAPEAAAPQVSNGDDELRQLLAQRDAELAELRANVKPVEPEPISIFESDERQGLIDALGEDVVSVFEKAQARALSTVRQKATERVSLLEQEANNLKASQARAEFIRSVPKGVMDTFNTKDFQDFAKGERLGRKTWADELNDIVQSNDLASAEILIEKVKGFQAGKQAIRKAQVPNGISPAVSGTQTAAFDLAQAKALERDLRRYPRNSPAYTEAEKRYEQYMALT
jgi:hypothetical protein